MRGQFSFEYLLVVGFALMIILPVTYYGYVAFQQSKTEVDLASIDKIGFEITNNARTVYNLGEHTRFTLQLNFPEGIENISIVGPPSEPEYYLEIDAYGSELLFYSPVLLSATFTEQNLNPGLKNVRLESKRISGQLMVDISIT